MKIFILLLLLAGCQESGTNEGQLFRTIPAATGAVSFSTLRDFILKPQCVGCHGWAQDEAQVRTRIIPGNAKASSLYVELATGKMPRGGGTLSPQQLKLVENYINGPLGEAPPVIALKPTYESLKVHLFEKSCTQCHNDNSRRLESFTTYENVTDEINDIVSAIENGEMPPLDADGNPRAPVPSDEVLATLQEWVVLGMPKE